MSNIDGLHICKICNKQYSCYKSLWNHTKKIHTPNNAIISQISVNNQSNISNNTSLINNYNCINYFRLKIIKIIFII